MSEDNEVEEKTNIYTHILVPQTLTHTHRKAITRSSGGWSPWLKFFFSFSYLYFLEWMCITFLIREGERKKCFCLLQRQNLSLWSRFGFGAWPPLSVDDLRIFGLWSPGFFRNDQIWWKHLPFPPFLFLSPTRSPTQLWGLLSCAGLWHEVGAQWIFVKDGMSECMGGSVIKHL